MINKKNKKRLVLFCYFLVRLNNKFINRIKVKVGLLLDASEVSLSAIETLVDIGLTVRRKTIIRQKAWHAEIHIITVGNFLSENVVYNFFISFIICK